MTQVILGCEVTIDRNAPTLHWFESQQERETHINAISATLRKTFDTREVKAIRVANVNGTVYAEHGPAAVHEKWRLTMLRASHRKHYCYSEWVAFVDTIGGKVVVCDKKKPFKPSMYSKWSREVTLEEAYPTAYGVELFWPHVRPALAGEQCHYRVLNAKDILTLNKVSRPHLFSFQLIRAGMDAQTAEALGAR